MKNTPDQESVLQYSRPKILSPKSFVNTFRAGMLVALCATVGGVCCTTVPKPEPQVVMCAPEIDRSWLDQPHTEEILKIYTMQNMNKIFPDIKPGLNEAEFTFRGIKFLARLMMIPSENKTHKGVELLLEVTEATKVRAQHKQFIPIKSKLIEI